MVRIYKYPFLIQPQFVLQLPQGAIIRHIGQDANSRGYREYCIWAEVDPNITIYCNRLFHVYGTGYNIKGEYVGTIVNADDGYVWHIYEEIIKF